MQCPICRDEYEDGVATCVTCEVPLLPPGAPAPMQTRHLGRFDARIGPRVTHVLRARGIPYDVEEHDDEWFVRVDATWRDDVASDLFTGWSELLHALDREVAYDLLAAGGSHPGWADAPTDAWTDRDGRLRVADDEGDPDSGRALGPALLLVGLSMLLLGLVDAIDPAIGITFGLVLAGVGAFLPR